MGLPSSRATVGGYQRRIGAVAQHRDPLLTDGLCMLIPPIARLMRVLTSFHLVSETGEHQYAYTVVSRALVNSPSADLHKHSWVHIVSRLDYMFDKYSRPTTSPDLTAVLVVFKNCPHILQILGTRIQKMQTIRYPTMLLSYLRKDPIRLTNFKSAMRTQMNVSSSQIPRSLL